MAADDVPLVYLLAGESSGDLHASNLLRELSARRPELRFRGMGGDRMAAAGMELVKHIRETDFMGFAEVLRNLPKIRRMFHELKADIRSQQPVVAVLVDYPGFNLRMAKWLHHEGIRVVYYISPQLWAWKTGRVELVRHYVDRMLVILPFEEAFYQKYNVPVDFVGHPLLDAIDARPDWGGDLREHLGLDSRPVLALLPGSRGQEIRRMLPPMQEAAQQFPDWQTVVAGASGPSTSLYHQLAPELPLSPNRTYDLLQLADCAMVTSGTATLETALFGVPQVVGYRGGWLSYQIARHVVGKRISHIALVNLILGCAAVPELVQSAATAERFAAELGSILQKPGRRANMEAAYRELRERLGEGGASARAASIVLEEIDKQAHAVGS